MDENKKIDYRFKILYAVGMVMVVCGHTYGGGISLASDWFPYAGFHLALFAFCSGYFYKRSSESHIGRYIIKKIKRLLLPLYSYTIVYGIIVQILKNKGFEIGGDLTLHNLLIMPITNGHQFIYNMGGWFIVPLFMIEVYNILFRKLIGVFNINITEFYIFIMNLVIGITGNQLACIGYRNGWWLVLVRMLYFVPFYELGVFYKNKIERLDKQIPGIWYFTFIFTVKLIIICIYRKVPIYTASWCNDFTEGPIMPVIIGYLGIAFWLRIAVILEPVIGKSKYINLIADNTYPIMMNQFIGFMIVKTIFALFNRYTLLFEDFDWMNYKSDIWYYYIPGGLAHTLILYATAGIVVPIMIQKIMEIHFKLFRWPGKRLENT